MGAATIHPTTRARLMALDVGGNHCPGLHEVACLEGSIDVSMLS